MAKEKKPTKSPATSSLTPPPGYDREDAWARFQAKVAQAEATKGAGQAAVPGAAPDPAPVLREKLLPVGNDPSADPALQRAFTLLREARSAAAEGEPTTGAGATGHPKTAKTT